MITLLSAHADGQYGSFPVRHFSMEDGLPSNTIYDIYKDSKGFLWFCTDKGVARYNGIRFEIFTTFNGLPDNEIFFAKEDNYGRIWFATFNGALCYFKSETFYTAENKRSLRLPYKTSFIKSIIVEKDNSVTISYYDQKIIVNVIEDSCHVVDVSKLPESLHWHATPTSVGLDILCAFKEANNRYALVCYGKKIIHINDSARVLYYSTSHDSFFHSIFYDRINYFIAQHAIYEGRSQKMIKTISRPGANYSRLNRVFSFNDYFYRCTDSGLFINPAEQTALIGGFRLLPKTEVSGIATDSVRNIWFSTLNNGVYAFPVDFNAYRIADSISSSKIVYATTQRNTVFFTTSKDDLFSLGDNGTRRLFSYTDMIGQSLRDGDQPVSLIDENLSFYNFYNQDNIVINYLLSPKRKMRVYRNRTGVKHIFSVGSQLYLQARRNLTLIDYDKMRPNEIITPDYSRYITSDSLSSDRIFCVTQNADKSIWYSTVNNMHRAVGITSTVQTQFRNIALKKFIFFHDKIIGYTHDNRLLICSNYSSNKLQLDTVSADNCIWENFYVLDKNHLLISTNNFFRLLTLHDRIHDFKVTAIEDDYIPAKADVICVDSSNCYFFQGQGVTIVRKSKLLIGSPAPKLIFTVCKATGHIFPLSGQSLVFSYADARSVSIGFASISYTGKSLTYQYAIDKDGATAWNEIQGNQINMTNPSYGTYTIKVRARSLDGEWSRPISYVVKINRPYWATWWFISCIALLVGVVVIYFVRRRINVIVKAKARENENKVRYLKSEYKALNALMNPHFIFNTLNNVQGLFNRDDKRAANEYLRIFADLVRQNMHNVSMEMISLEKEMELVKNYLLLEKLRFKDNLHYEVTIDEKVDASEIMVPPLLIQPLVENSIKHGILPLESSSGIVKVDISERNSILYIRVADNGVGFNSKEHKKDSAHISFGLDNIRRRIEQLSAILEKDLTFEMKEEQVDGQRWTVAIIAIPV